MHQIFLKGRKEASSSGAGSALGLPKVSHVCFLPLDLNLPILSLSYPTSSDMAYFLLSIPLLSLVLQAVPTHFVR